MVSLFKKSVTKKEYDWKTIAKASTCSNEQVIDMMNGNMFGLSESEANYRLEKYGENDIKPESKGWFYLLLLTFLNPFVIVLLLISLYSFISYFLTSDEVELFGGIIVLFMVFLSIFISYIQDIRAKKSSDKLIKMVNTDTLVYRYNFDDPRSIVYLNNSEIFKKCHNIPLKNIVPGDIVYLSAGDLVPADMRILFSKDLSINESTLTGESLPQEKHATLSSDDFNFKKNFLGCQNIIYKGTSVSSGYCIAIALKTGASTYFGFICKSLNSTKKTNFDKQVRKISFFLICLMFAMLPIVFLGYKFLGFHGSVKTTEAFLFAASIVVGLTPEMMPLIITSTLSKSARLLMRKRIIVKNLISVQNLGSMEILCCDKTGTLTEDRIELVNYYNIFGKKSEEILKYGYLNSYFQTNLKNNLDYSVIDKFTNENKKFEIDNLFKVDEIPFDFKRKMMSVIVDGINFEKSLICKGAFEEVINKCNKVKIDQEILPLTDQYIKKISLMVKKLNDLGQRVLVVSYKPIKDPEKTIFSVKDENDLIFLGVLGFLDIPKSSAKKIISKLNHLGVKVKILTGDNERTTLAIANKIDLNFTKDDYILGDEIDSLSDLELERIVAKKNIFAKLSPLQKERIIKVLQKNFSVGFLGDGINDAICLKTSDVGISVNNAADVAKESSSMILLEKDLEVIYDGILSGRKTYINIIKYLKITIFSNFGNTISVLMAMFWFSFLPMLPIQILFQNLLYDISQLAIPWDNVDPEDIRKPTKWTTKNIIPFICINGVISSIFDLLTFAFAGYVLTNLLQDPSSINNPTNLKIFHTAWFLVGVFTQVCVFHTARTKKIPFLQSSASPIVFVFSLLVLLVSVSITFIPFTIDGFQFSPLPLKFFIFLFFVVIFYFLIANIGKKLYIKIYKKWF
ncbi:magnesium-translocating P-type ATPase [symbiont of Argiope bruennichi]|uniref:magnesium-translocating P-type ATPase n=1 Tax=symbiont of Argiope bruennichi TaxID=2810479 RepID=UPI003DA26193